MGIVKGSLDKGKIRLQRKLKIPNYLTFETTADAFGYFWTNSVGTLQYGTVEPTTSTYDTAGTSLTTTTASNAALSNLSSVAVNTHIVSDTDSTDNLGSSSIYWANAYLDKVFLNSTATMEGTTSAGVVTLVGNLTGGVSGTGSAFKFYATTAGGYLHWDDTANSNAGGLIFTDDAQGIFGDESDFTMQWNASAMVLDNKTASTGNLLIGSIVDTDVTLESQSAAGKDINWDASAYTLRFLDTTIVGFGTGDSTDYDIGLAYAAANTLSWTQKIAGTGSILKGVNGKGIDETWYAETAGDYMMWDQDGGTGNVGALLFEDSLIKISGANVHYELGISTDSLLLDATDHANAKLILGSTGTNGLDVDFIGASSGDHVKFVSTGTWTYTDVPVTMTGADSSGTLLTITGIDLTLNSDTVLIDHSGDGYAINIDLNEATSDGIKVEAFTNHTVPLILLDGDTAGFLGASNVGMLTIQNDIALTNVNSSALVIDVGTVKPKDAAEGYCLRIIDTSLVATTPPAYAAYIDTTANEGLAIETRAAAAKNLVLMGVAGQTDVMLHVDGGTGAGWDGANGVGMVQLNGDGAHAHANASLLNIVDATGASIGAGRGTSLRIIDTTTVGADSWVAYIDTTKNDGLLINTGDAAGINLKLTGLQAQTAPMMLIDASTGTGWDGADDVGALEITSDSILVANGATLLRVESSAQQKSGSEGALARFENTGAAQAGAVMVEIVAKDSTEVALNCGAGIVKSTEYRGTITNRQATDAGGGLAVCVSGETFIVADAFTADDGDILQLYAAVAGTVIWIYNDDTTNDFVVEPFGTETINGGGAGAGVTLGQLEYLRLVCMVDGKWIASEFSAAGAMTTAA